MLKMNKNKFGIIPIIAALLSSSAFASQADQVLGQALLQAMQRGTVRGAQGQIQQLAQSGSIRLNGKTFHLSRGLNQLLNTMLNTGENFEILSLARDCNCFHGTANGVVMAMDISSYRDNPIRITDPSTAKAGVLSFMLDLEQGSYDFGIPRAPVVGDNAQARRDRDNYRHLGLWTSNPIPELKPEFPLASLEKFLPTRFNEVPPNVDFMKSIQFIQDPDYRSDFVDVVLSAQMKGVKFGLLYADALDHMHVKVNSDPNPLP